MMNDARWKQRFSNYVKSLRHLKRMAELAEKRPLSENERTVMVKYFEMSEELVINVFRDCLRELGIKGLAQGEDVVREACAHGLIMDKALWLGVVEGRRKAHHIYDEGIAQKVAEDITKRFYPAFAAIAQNFTWNQTKNG